jgi:hypothetical protein
MAYDLGGESPTPKVEGMRALLVLVDLIEMRRSVQPAFQRRTVSADKDHL